MSTTGIKWRFGSVEELVKFGANEIMENPQKILKTSFNLTSHVLVWPYL
jgi:hypothetical protein